MPPRSHGARSMRRCSATAKTRCWTCSTSDGLLSTPQRNVTTTATQALLMINSEHTLKRAGAWAGKLKAAKFADDKQLVEVAYRTAFGRLPSDSESNAAVHFLTSGKRDQTIVDFCHALLNANEFLYVD